MRLILRSDVDHLGTKGDIVEVADGYARNFLLPRNMAMVSTKGAEAQAERMRRSRESRDAAARAAAEEVATTLVPTTIHVEHRVGSGEKLFGSVTPVDVAEAIEAQTGVEVDRRQVHIDEAIRTAGNHQVRLKLHSEVEFPVNLEVSET